MGFGWPYLLALMATTSALASVPPLIEAQVHGAVAIDGARVRIASYRPSLPTGCTPTRAEVPPIRSSAQIAVRLFGQRQTSPCDGWAWVRLQLFVKALVTRQAVDAGAPLNDAVAPVEREVLLGRTLLTALPPGAVAAHRLGPGVALETTHLGEIGPRPGNEVTIRIQAGALVLEQTGRAVGCRRGLACALLPNGRRVEGRWDGERINLEEP